MGPKFLVKFGASCCKMKIYTVFIVVPTVSLLSMAVQSMSTSYRGCFEGCGVRRQTEAEKVTTLQEVSWMYAHS